MNYSTIFTPTSTAVAMPHVFNDGGRSNYFKGAKAGDCVPRAITIATGLDYKFVYDELNRLTKEYADKKGQRTKVSRAINNKTHRRSVRNGTYDIVSKPFMASLGWEWQPTMFIGSGCTVHVKADELPTNKGNLILRLSRHWTAVVSGELHDTYDCSRNGTRGVYGYFWKPVG